MRDEKIMATETPVITTLRAAASQGDQDAHRRFAS
jgi:hypothetical protein